MGDPREILRAAGVECAEVEAIYDGKPNEIRDGVWFMCKTDTIAAAILALARLVAKYKWQRDQAVADHCATGPRLSEGVADCEYCSGKIADLDRRWEERDA